MTLEKLGPSAASRLKKCERIIDKGMATFVTVGMALAEIKKDGLYKATHSSFEAYVRERWDTTRDHAYKLIRAAATSHALGEADFDLMPAGERQVRPLTSLPGEDAIAAWDAAVADAGGQQPTVAEVENAARRYRDTEIAEDGSCCEKKDNPMVTQGKGGKTQGRGNSAAKKPLPYKPPPDAIGFLGDLAMKPTGWGAPRRVEKAAALILRWVDSREAVNV